jgi:hypothetical protein
MRLACDACHILEKGNTISEIIVRFDKEIRALQNAIAKVNKNFWFIALVEF